MFGYANFCWLCRSFLSIHLYQFNKYVNGFVHILLLLQKLLILNMMVFCALFLWSFILQGKQHVRGRNIDGTKVEARAKIQHFFNSAFEKFYIGIWSCMLIRMLWKFLHCYCHKTLLTNLFSFGGMNNV